ncbi:hypothetical protein E2C01_096579 [Portunus trituberculatus]|uniref:Uncharacterized protein n=1 Tax=Portunus trituberculatus TaxID=210409 RepID=A0A5B7K778_PORTR|nr:hypothetical protein [Portunus trituberculatus]
MSVSSRHSAMCQKCLILPSPSPLDALGLRGRAGGTQRPLHPVDGRLLADSSRSMSGPPGSPSGPDSPLIIPGSATFRMLDGCFSCVEASS